MTRAPLKVDLRAYQVDVIQRLRAAIGAGDRRPLLVAPTGAGKTIIAAAIIESAVQRRSQVLFLAHRRELITQAAQKLWNAADVDAGVIMAGHPLRPDEPVQVASVQTLWHRAMRTSAIDRPEADLVIVDEAHRARAQTYQKILDAYPGAVILGLTATPCRGDGRGLGNIFDRIVECPPVGELVALGHLVPTVVYAPDGPELTGVRVERGDYVEKQLAERMDVPQLVGDVVAHWLKLGRDCQTVVFASGVQHSVHLRDEFRRAGIWAEHVDGKTPVEERDAILQRLADGQVQVVCNYGVLTEGWDCPAVSCCVLARPTKNMGLYRQMVGRVLRPASGKTDALVLDHAGATHEHGFVEEPVEWSLDTDKRAANPRTAGGAGGDTRSFKDCPECGALRSAGKPCGACGWKPNQKARDVEVADGELARLDRDGAVQSIAWDRVSFYKQLLWIARERGYKDGWAAHKFKEKFGTFPRRTKVPPEEPTPEVRAWVRSRQIAFAKSKEKQQAGAAA
jgi:superfamily II DNA or RNA helicase